jgi:multidrug efflux pump subunit AcrB
VKPLISFFIGRPTLVNLIVVMVFILGFVTIEGLRYEYNPKVDFASVNITTVHSGSGPEETELAITLPLEEELLKVDGLKKIVSRSMENLSLISVRVDIDAGDQEKILNDIQKAVERANTRLPGDLVEKPQVEQVSTLITPVAEVHVLGDVSEELLRRVARKVEDGLREVKGITSVEKVGYRRPEVRILLRQDKQVALGISLREVVEAIKKRNVRDSGGSVDSFLTEKKVVTVGQFKNPADVAEVIIRSAEPGNVVRLRDIAQVVLDYEDWQVQSRTDGVTSIALLARKQELADELHTARWLREFVQAERETLPPGVELKVVNDISRLTVNALEILSGNAILGFVLVLLLLCYFLNYRFALWVAVGIPFAICLCFLLLAGINVTINVMTLTAIILLLGILVDDAVVVGENIQRLRELGIDAHEASVLGTEQVARPVIFSALTTVLAFFPLLFMAGEWGAFMTDFVLTIIVLLLASLFESQCILPSHLAKVRRLPDNQLDRGLRRLQARYRSLMLRLLARRYLTLVGFVCGFALVLVFGALTISFHLYPEADIDTVNVKLELPPGSSIEQTRQRTVELEAEIWQQLPQEDVLNIVSQTGHHDTDMYGFTDGRNQGWAVISVYLKPVNYRDANTFEVVEQLREWAATKTGFQSLVVEALTDAPATGKPIEVEIIGNGVQRFELAEELQQWLRQQEEVTEVWSSHKPGKDIIDLDMRHELLAARGLTVQDVVEGVGFAVDGLPVEEMQTLDERIRFRLQLPPGQAGKLATLESLSLINSEGQAIYLKSVVDFRVRPGEADIKHYLGKRTITIFGDIDRDAASVEQINHRIRGYIEEQNWRAEYKDFRFWFGGEYEIQQEQLGSLGRAFLFCVLGIFAALIILFNSVSQPVLILLCIPFGITGVIIGFGIQGLSMGAMALTGIIGLVGVLVNDSLVMVHRLNQSRREKGESLAIEEIADITGQRFRPILITSMTTVVGLLPTAYGILGENSYITPMVMAMAWGVMFGGLVSLILLPCLYAADQDIRGRLAAVLRPRQHAAEPGSQAANHREQESA